MMKQDIVILGAGPAGISAGYHLKQQGISAEIYEKKDDFGGLCGSFLVGGYRFDHFAHMTFSRDPAVNALLEKKTDYLTHTPEAYNFYRGKWVRNPVQNNLIGLDVEERIAVIKGFLERPKVETPRNYREWLQGSYGDYFTDHFPARYTRKYWTVEPEALEPEWARSRMYVPDLTEVLRGAMSEETPNVHYSKEMHYPVEGGFRGFLEPLVKGLDIRYGKRAEQIDFEDKSVVFSDGGRVRFDRLISTLPLSELPHMTRGLPKAVEEAAERLDYTSGYMVSIGLKRNIEFPSVWFYIYDEDILPARIYFSNKKSSNNAPEGCSALQAEVYVSKYRRLELSAEKLKEQVIRQLLKLGLFAMEDIAVTDIRFEKYANIMFTPGIYEARAVVRAYLEAQGVVTAGRFGEWDYLWLEQSLLSGKRAAGKVLEKRE